MQSASSQFLSDFMVFLLFFMQCLFVRYDSYSGYGPSERKRANANEWDSTIIATCRNLRPGLGTFWQYAKIECAPPLVKPFLQGPVGVKLEEAGAKLADGVISSIAKVIHDMDVAEARAKAAKEAALKKKIEDMKKAKKEKKRQEALKAKAAKEKLEAEKKAKLEEEAKKAKEAAPKPEDKPEPTCKPREKKPKKSKPKKNKPKNRKPKKKAPPEKKK